LRFIRTVCSLRGRLRRPPWARVSNQCSTSAAIGGGSIASRLCFSASKEETRSSFRSPARPRISAARVTLRSLECSAGDSWDQAISSPSWCSARTRARARPVSMTILGFQPRVSASSPAMRLVRRRASLVMLDATQWSWSNSRDSPRTHNSSCVQAVRAGGRVGWAAWVLEVGPVWPRRVVPASDSCQCPVGAKSCWVSRRLSQATVPACSQQSRQWPFLSAMTRRQCPHWPGG
jgi:hypothetical protein